MHCDSPWEGLLGEETECHISEQSLLLQKGPEGFLWGKILGSSPDASNTRVQNSTIYSGNPGEFKLGRLVVNKAASLLLRLEPRPLPV